MGTYARAALPCWLLALGLAGCGLGGRANPVRTAMAEHRSAPGERPAVAFRFAAERGADARLYVLPQLHEAAWRFHVPGLDVAHVVGFSGDADDVYLVGGHGDLVGLDLGTGRAREIDSTVVAAALGPTGTLHFIRADGSVGAINYRTVTMWPARLEGEPTQAWGGASQRLLVLEPDPKGRQLVAISASAPPVRQRLPDGALTVSPWGDLAVVTVDSGLFVLDPADADLRRFRRFRDRSDAVAFSPSEHQLYVALASGTVLALDRYSRTLEQVEKMELPAPARALRVDPLGRMLLARPAQGDSIWLVDLATHRVTGTLPGSWRDDLPAIAPDGTILVVEGHDVVARSADSLTVEGHVPGGARDTWLTAAWDPRRPALQLAAEAALPAARAGAGEKIYVQVSSTANQAWAEDNARSLRAAGMQASVLPPSAEEDRYRVVLGPYPTREAADAVGHKLGRPYWIFTKPGQDEPQ